MSTSSSDTETACRPRTSRSPVGRCHSTALSKPPVSIVLLMVGDAAGKRVRNRACAIRWHTLFNASNRERWRASRETDGHVGERIRESDRLGFHLDLRRSGGKRRQDLDNVCFVKLDQDGEDRRSRFDDRGCVVKLIRDTDKLSRDSDRCWASSDRCLRVVEWLREANRLGSRDDTRRPGDNRRDDLEDAAFHLLCERRHAGRTSRDNCIGIVERLNQPDLFSARRQRWGPSRERGCRVERRGRYFLVCNRRKRGRSGSERRSRIDEYLVTALARR